MNRRGGFRKLAIGFLALLLIGGSMAARGCSCAPEHDTPSPQPGIVPTPKTNAR